MDHQRLSLTNEHNNAGGSNNYAVKIKKSKLEKLITDQSQSTRKGKMYGGPLKESR